MKNIENINNFLSMEENNYLLINQVSDEIGIFYLHVIQYLKDTPGGDFHEMGGIYMDELLLTEQGWRIENREIELKWAKGNPLVRDSKPS